MALSRHVQVSASEMQSSNIGCSIKSLAEAMSEATGGGHRLAQERSTGADIRQRVQGLHLPRKNRIHPGAIS
jgi:hypothetical protein